MHDRNLGRQSDAEEMPPSDEPHDEAHQDDQKPPDGDVKKPAIQLSTDLTAMVNKLQRAISKLGKGPHLFQRARQLCIISSSINPPTWLRRPPDAPVIIPVDPAYVRELATKAARLQKYDKRGKAWEDTLPPLWVIETLYARPGWPFPLLEGIVCAPTLRPDGSLLATQAMTPTPGCIWT